MEFEFIEFNRLKPADWRANYVLRPDLDVLCENIYNYGWIAPIVVQKNTMIIIDGFHRWICAQTDKQIIKRDKKRVPVVYKDVDDIDARIMHIALNRGRGQIVGSYMSQIIRDIYHSKKYSLDEIKEIFSMSVAEVGLMMDGSVFKQRNIAEFEYSKAWVPIEAPKDAVEELVDIEKPPNPDR